MVTVPLLTVPWLLSVTCPANPPLAKLKVKVSPFMLLPHEALAVALEMQDCPVMPTEAVALPPIVGGVLGLKVKLKLVGEVPVR